MEIVTKAKKSCVAFEKPAPHKAGRGRPPKKGPAVRRQELFLSHKEDYRMYFPGTEAADRGIVLPVLVKAYAQSVKIQKFRFSHSADYYGIPLILITNLKANCLFFNAISEIFFIITTLTLKISHVTIGLLVRGLAIKKIVEVG